MFAVSKILSAISPSTSPGTPRRKKSKGFARRASKKLETKSSRRSSEQKQQEVVKLLLVANDTAARDSIYEEIFAKTTRISDCYSKELATSGVEFSYFGLKFALIDAIASGLHKDITSEKSLLCCDDSSLCAAVFVFNLANADNWSESLKLFKFFSKKMPSIPRIVILTQMQCFGDRLATFQFSDMFPSYSGDNSAKSCIEFINMKAKFQSSSTVPLYVQMLDSEVCSLKNISTAYREMKLLQMKAETGLLI